MTASYDWTSRFPPLLQPHRLRPRDRGPTPRRIARSSGRNQMPGRLNDQPSTEHSHEPLRHSQARRWRTLPCTSGQLREFRPLKEGVPNALAPRKRPRTTLSPSLGFWDGTPWLAFGTPGGDQQDQWSLLLLLRMAHHGMTLQQAIDAPAFHTTHVPNSFAPRGRAPGGLVVEDRLGGGVVAELGRRGHRVTRAGPHPRSAGAAVCPPRSPAARANPVAAAV
jgi:hypothetical protein